MERGYGFVVCGWFNRKQFLITKNNYSKGINYSSSISVMVGVTILFLWVFVVVAAVNDLYTHNS